MKPRFSLHVDQFGNRYYARTLKELRKQIPGKVSRMFFEDKSGNVYHCGYVIGKRWLNSYTMYAVKES